MVDVRTESKSKETPCSTILSMGCRITVSGGQDFSAVGVSSNPATERSPGSRLMANFKKTVATAKAKVAKAENEAFTARLEAIDAILQDASPHDVLTLCARALAEVVPNCCEGHQDEFKAEFLRVLSDCVAIRQEQDEAEADEDGDAHTSVH